MTNDNERPDGGEPRRGLVPQAVLIAGPTASGKSGLALAVAERIGGTVVNADSMQVYRELSILTARPSTDEVARVPHRLYGHVPAAESYTVKRWMADIEGVLAEKAATSRMPIVVGGTGLYFTALTRGLSDIPPVAEAVRARWRAAAEVQPAQALHAELARRDPEMAARLRPSDAQRVVRALEVLESTGRSLAAWQGERSRPLLDFARCRAVVLAPDRAWLHGRIAERFRQMVEAGGLEEARALAALGLDPSLPAMKAIGVPAMISAATGEMSVPAAIEAAITATRQYAKRQETWFRNQMADWHRVAPDDRLAADRLSAGLK